MDLNTEEFSKFANSLADDASKTSMHYFRNKIEIEIKDDASPVTLADKETEQKLRDKIRREYPEHGILGEEYENEKIDSEFIWVIDPIDGTRSYIAGHKDFGNFIALLHNKKPILGIINCPAHNERWLGIKNNITKCNGRNVQTSGIKKIKDAYLLTTGLHFQEPQIKKGLELLKEQTRYYKFGGHCYMYGMLASGLIDIVLENTLKVHDYMALVNVIEGAGGVITDKYGKDISLESDGSLVASSSNSLHDEIIKLIN